MSEAPIGVWDLFAMRPALIDAPDGAV